MISLRVMRLVKSVSTTSPAPTAAMRICAASSNRRSAPETVARGVGWRRNISFVATTSASADPDTAAVRSESTSSSSLAVSVKLSPSTVAV